MSESPTPSKGPKYLLLAERIRKKIQEGVYEVGRSIPLTEDPSLQISRSKSVRQKALRRLEEEGWITAVQGDDWIASKPRPVEGVQMICDPAMTVPTGAQELEVRVLSKTMATLPAEFLEHFEIHGVEGKKASRIAKVYSEKGKPVLLETIFAPASLLSGLVMKDHRHDNIYRILESGYKVRISNITQRARLRPATEEEAMALQIDPKSPLLAIDRVLLSREGGLAIVKWAFPDAERGVSDFLGTIPGQTRISQ